MNDEQHDVPPAPLAATPETSNRPAKVVTLTLRAVILAALAAEAVYMVARFGGMTRGMDALLLPMCLLVVLPAFAIAHVPAWLLAHRITTESGFRAFVIAFAPLLVTFAVAFGFVAGDWDKLWFPIIATVPTMLALSTLRTFARRHQPDQ